MPYIGRDLNRGNYLKLDDISSSFNSSTTTFNLTVGGSAFTPGSAFSILVSVGGVIQEPESAYQVNNSEITFANAPTAQDSFFCIALGVSLGIGVPGNGTVNGPQMAKPFSYDGFFYLDDANNRVGIGSLSPTSTLDVRGDTKISGILTATSFSGPIGNPSGISTFYDLRVTNNLTVEGTTSTLDTDLIGVDRVEVGANSDSVVGVAITQSGTADILRLYDGSSQVVTVLDTGEVGINISNPTDRFHVYHPTENFVARFESGDTGGGITLKDNTHVTSLLTTNGAFEINVDQGGDLSSSESLSFKTSGTEKLKVDSSGNVYIAGNRSGNDRGIIYNDPNGFGIYGSASGTNHRNILFFSSSSGSSEKLRITSAGRVQVKNGTLDLGTADTSSGHINSAEVLTFNIDTDNDDTNRYFAFYKNGSDGSGTELLRISEDGKVGIGTNSPTTQSGKVFHLHAGSAQQRFHMTNNTTGTSATDGFEILIDQETNANCRIRNFEAGDMMFDTGGSNNEVMRLTSGGSVGIGSQSPSGVLDLYHATNNTILNVKSGDAGSVINLIDNATRSSIEQNGASLKIVSDTDAAYANSDIRLQVDGATKVKIDSSGQITNTGIETSFVTTMFGANFAKLDIRGTNIANSNHYILSYGEGHANDHEFHMVNTIGDLVFRTGSGGNTERLYINTSGSVIIGGDTFGAAGTFSVGANGTFRSVLASGTAQDTLLGAISGVSNGFQITTDTSNNQSYRFHNGTTETFRIHTNGKIGIGGTSIPSKKLNINTTGTSGEGILLRATDSTYPSFIGDANRSGTDLFLVALQGYWNGNRVGEVTVESGSNTDDKDEGMVKIRTRDDGDSSPQDRFTVYHTGQVEVHSTTQSTTTTSGALKVGGGIGVAKNIICGGALEVQNNTLTVTSGAPNIMMAVPSGGLDSRIYNDGNGLFRIGHGTNSSAPTERLYIDSNGSVIIAETKLHATRVQAKFGIDCHGLDIYDGVNSPVNYGMVFYNDPNTDKANGIGFFNDDGQSCGGYIVHQDKGGSNVGDIVMATSATANTPVPRFRVKAGGGVQIGASNSGSFTSAGLILDTPVYKEYQYTWEGHNSYTIDLTCGSYFHSEVIYVQHQTNGGNNIQNYARMKWANNHTTHTGYMYEFSGQGTNAAVSTTFTVSDQSGGGSVDPKAGLTAAGAPGASYRGQYGGGSENYGSIANGRLRISETYNGSGLSASTRGLIVRVYFGSFNISIS